VLLECGENRLWQKGLWDTRIYSWDSYREKLNYVMANPVRAGLVEESDAWPYQGMIHQVGWFD
jgi:putative transposase